MEDERTLLRALPNQFCKDDCGKATLTDQEQARLRRLALELATPSPSQLRVYVPTPFTRYVAIGVVIAAKAGAGWLTYRGEWDRVIPEVHAFSMKAGVVPPPPPSTYQGKPDAKVWIDVHTAL
jgi:hypothetical protein